jgi:hypothetical protein
MSLSSQDRVVRSLNFETANRVTNNMDGMITFVCNGIVKEKSLAYRRAKLYDSCGNLMEKRDCTKESGKSLFKLLCTLCFLVIFNDDCVNE